MPTEVVHLIDTGGPGGAETVYHQLVTRLEPSRWRSVAAVPSRDWLFDSLRDSGVEPRIVAMRGSFDLSYLRTLARLLDGAALVHSHLLTTSLYGALAARWNGIPAICTFHGLADIQGDPRVPLKFRLIRHLGKAHIVFVSESLRRTFLSMVPLDERRTSVIPNGIDTSRFRPGRDARLRRELGAAEDDILVGAVGNVRPSKAYDVLLRAAAMLRDSSARPLRFVIVGQGDGELYDRLQRLRAELRLETVVRFAGFRSDIPDVMRNLDVYVSSSSAEGFSLTTVEAMASGVPVIATRSGGPEEIIEDGVNGLLVPPNSPGELARAIRSLADDASLQQRLRAAALETVRRRYTVETMVRRYEQLYEACLRAPRRALDARVPVSP